ncbi:hypothetical protein CRUP_000760 [Coryphaenoides rupestris]|nr:hypothetical protein CRUP_000760 [Coryphaenoides rupestris]
MALSSPSREHRVQKPFSGRAETSTFLGADVEVTPRSQSPLLPVSTVQWWLPAPRALMPTTSALFRNRSGMSGHPLCFWTCDPVEWALVSSTLRPARRSSMSLPVDDLQCPVVRDIFTDPVLLSCSHSFLQGNRYWETSGTRGCPVCRKRTSKAGPTTNLALRNLCESVQDARRESLSAKKEAEEERLNCELHAERLKLFCLVDKEPICVVCHLSKTHKNHECSTIQEALVDCKNQAAETQLKIQAQFEQLHQALRHEESDRLAALKREEEEKLAGMKEKISEVSEEMRSLQESFSALESELDADDMTVLQNFKAIQDSSDSRALKLSCRERISSETSLIFSFIPASFSSSSLFRAASLSDSSCRRAWWHTTQMGSLSTRQKSFNLSAWSSQFSLSSSASFFALRLSLLASCTLSQRFLRARLVVGPALDVLFLHTGHPRVPEKLWLQDSSTGSVKMSQHTGHWRSSTGRDMLLLLAGRRVEETRAHSTGSHVQKHNLRGSKH